jgi:hypothetical protein
MIDCCPCPRCELSRRVRQKASQSSGEGPRHSGNAGRLHYRSMERTSGEFHLCGLLSELRIIRGIVPRTFRRGDAYPMAGSERQSAIRNGHAGNCAAVAPKV